MPQITLVLHNIRSTHNVGSILRTAEGFGAKNIVCSGYTPYPLLPNDTRLPHLAAKLTSQIHKTALGAETLLPIAYYAELDAWLAHNELPLVALEQSPRSIHIADFVPPNQFALLLGEEVDGVDPMYLTRCDTVIEIPMHGKKESFNVSVATGIALYHATSTGK